MKSDGLQMKRRVAKCRFGSTDFKKNNVQCSLKCARIEQKMYGECVKHKFVIIKHFL